MAGSAPVLSYADLADLATVATVVVKAEIADVMFLKPAQSAGLRQGFRRAYIRAKAVALIRGEGGIAPMLSYIYDVPVDARGKPIKLKKRAVLLFARPTSRPGEIQLVAPDGQVNWSGETESVVRTLVSELLAAKSPPKILGLGDAFHVAGTVQGEGETQIFLRTDSGEPVSLSVIRRPGQDAKWAVALGEIVDEAAESPNPGTLLWYRLACSLPPSLPSSAVRTLAVTDAEAARTDYQLIVERLGPCGRTRAIR
ncbi:MAG: hypothetical protein QHC67_15825 [Sphingobium sp.]|uniref:hypothetical protein n=1 Tax=Sphingobium sp. TaxID=1912891 RepID=UPI0029BC5EFB|nr:hypothetical protein [Sphingobium sp.]MDX3911266.1 hypothetical protein [Sphingobium sp.]